MKININVVITASALARLVNASKSLCKEMYDIPSSKATELCQEGHDFCRFFFQHNGVSCAEYCEEHGGECVRVDSNWPGYTCGRIESRYDSPKKCTDTGWSDNICECTKPRTSRSCFDIPDTIDEDDLKPNRYILLDDGTFRRGGSKRVDYTADDTGGCSCYQMLNALGKSTSGQKKYGCRRSTIRKFIERQRYLPDKREVLVMFPTRIRLEGTDEKIKGCIGLEDDEVAEGNRLELRPCNKCAMDQCWSFKYRKYGDRLYRIHPCQDKSICVEASGMENFDEYHLSSCASKNEMQYFDWGPTTVETGAVRIRPAGALPDRPPTSPYRYGTCMWPDNSDECFGDGCEGMPVISRNCRWPQDEGGNAEGWIFKKSKALKKQ